MNLLKTALLIGFVLPAASCSTDSGPPEAAPVVTYADVDPATLTSLQNKVVDITYASALAQGLDIDADCMRAVGAQLDETDAALIVNATAGAELDLSRQGASLAFSMRRCVAAPPTTTVVVATTSG